MSVDIDDPRHQGEAAGIDHLVGSAFTDITDRSDATLGDSNVCAQRVMAEPVDNRRAADHQLMHGNSL